MGKYIHIIKEAVDRLLEGRLEDVKSKYVGVKSMEAIIDNMSQGDPSGNNKYLGWMAKVYQETPDTSRILKVVQSFHTNNTRINTNMATEVVDANKSLFPGRSERSVKGNPKDVNSYPTLKALELITNEAEEATPVRDDRDKIYQDERFTVIVPKTHAASCKYGVHSNWCVSTSSSNYFGQYTEDRDALLFFVLWRTKYDKDDEVEYKMAANVRLRDWDSTRQWDWFDKKDNSIDAELPVNMLPKSLIEAIEKYTYDVAKREGKIMDTENLLKNTTVLGKDRYGGIVFIPDDINDNTSEFTKHEDFDWVRDEILESMEDDDNTVGYITIDRDNDLDYSIITPADDYISWANYQNRHMDFISYLISGRNDFTWGEGSKEWFTDFIRTRMTEIAGRWLRTDTTRLKIGDKVRWKKGRGYYEQQMNPWNEAEINRQTPGGFFVTTGTTHTPKGKRFKPSSGKYMDVWTNFDTTNFDIVE